jgi:diguanylate cyclase (GGDEF)-like protein
MSFRTRLTGFFIFIVVVPMFAVGFLVFRLISDSEQGKADARASGIATAAASVYTGAQARARSDARTFARQAADAPERLAALASRTGLARVTVTNGGQTILDVGDRTAIAPGFARVDAANGGGKISVATSELTAADYARDLVGQNVQIVVSSGGRTLASTDQAAGGRTFPRQGTVTVGGTSYRAVTETFSGFDGNPVQVTVLSSLVATATSVGTSRLLAAFFIAGFLLLAFAFSVLASREIQKQLGRFLQAARRLGGGDFSSAVPTEGRDEFAALGAEFNNMSSQLERRLQELGQERARLRQSIRRIGETFASNLDRPALLGLALTTAIDAVDAHCGRLSARSSPDAPLAEASRVGSLAGMEEQIYAAERDALAGRGVGETAAENQFVASVALGPIEPGSRSMGLITVVREERPFTDDDRDLLRSLASQATLALENVDLHYQVRRQAVTDELTGLANHGRFQELLRTEIEQVRRYHHSVGLIMLDLDNFKSINDRYGHPQGDVVLKHVARILRESSRDADAPARYGGEELALILPHTDLEGAHAIAERVRAAIAAVRIPRIDGEGVLQITASLGVAASTEGDKDTLIADADAALYEAKRQGKNRTMRAEAQTANVLSGE